MSLLNFINEHDLRSKWIDLSFVGTPGTCYITLDDALSSINSESNSKATYIKGNLFTPWYWNGATNTTQNGLTITSDWKSNTITINGTATATTEITLVVQGLTPYSPKVFAGKMYRLSGCPSGGSTSTYWLSTESGNDTGNGFYFTPSSTTTIGLNLHIANGTTLNNAVFKPTLEICSNSSTASAFEVFGEKINRNLVDMESLFNASDLIFQDDGSVTGMADTFATKTYSIPSSLAGSTITASATVKSAGLSNVGITIDICSSSGTMKVRSYPVSGTNQTAIWATATVESGDYVKIRSNNNTAINVAEFQVELGAEPTDYKPYEAISDDKDYVSVVRLTKDIARNETETVTTYPDNLILDLNGHKLTTSSQVGRNNGAAANTMCFYGMKTGSEITGSDHIVLYARNKETYILGGTYECTYASTTSAERMVYNVGQTTSAYGKTEYQNSRTEVLNAAFKRTSTLTENPGSAAANAMLIQNINNVFVENCTVDMTMNRAVIGIEYYAIQSSGINRFFVRNSKIEISSSSTNVDDSIRGIYIAGGNSGTGTFSYEIRDSFIRAISPDRDDGSAIGVDAYMAFAQDNVKNYIINSEIYGVAQGCQLNTHTVYVRNCILGGGGHGGIYTGYGATVYITDTCLQRVYEKIDNIEVPGAAGLSYFGYGSNTYLDNCTYWIDPHYDQIYHAHITVKPGAEAYKDKTNIYVSNFKIYRIRVDGYSSCYVGENVTNLDGTDKPIIWFNATGSIDGNVYYTDESYRRWIYPDKIIEELEEELKECRKLLVNNSDKITVSDKYDNKLLSTANLKTIMEYLTSGGDNNVGT
jgi:hypothetical protein